MANGDSRKRLEERVRENLATQTDQTAGGEPGPHNLIHNSQHFHKHNKDMDKHRLRLLTHCTGSIRDRVQTDPL